MSLSRAMGAVGRDWPLLLLVLAGLLAAHVVAAIRGRPGAEERTSAQTLHGRRAPGDIDMAGYHLRLGMRQTHSSASRPGHGWRATPMRTAALVSVVLAAVAAGCTSSRAGGTHSSRTSAPRSCTAPALPGQVVDVTLADMGAMMGGTPSSGMMGGSTQGMGSSGGRLRATASPSAVPAGQVSFRVHNTGGMVHELVILPLPPGGAGRRPVGADGKVNEDGSLGEASSSCAAGSGDGIAPGATGWVTVRLARGRQELLCNLPGHYAAGMFTTLDVH
jgi:uncharacterized cupredoxin-like copper-binding protein